MGMLALTVVAALALGLEDEASPSEPLASPRRSGREVQELLPDARPPEQVTPGFPIASEADRPAFLRLRSVGGAAALGGLVGFGAGYYYAGNARWGVAMSFIDTALLVTFGAVTFSLHEDIAQNDFIAEASLARGERDMTSGERRLYTASWAVVATAVLSRAFQAFDGARAAVHVNDALMGFSFVPLGEGGGASLSVPLD